MAKLLIASPQKTKEQTSISLVNIFFNFSIKLSHLYPVLIYLLLALEFHVVNSYQMVGIVPSENDMPKGSRLDLDVQMLKFCSIAELAMRLVSRDKILNIGNPMGQIP